MQTRLFWNACLVGYMFLTIAAHGAPQSPSSPPQGAISIAPETKSAARELIGESLLNGQAYEYDQQLADSIGPRLTGSENYEKAVLWAEQRFKMLGLAHVHTEEWNMPQTWEPETPAAGYIVSPIAHTLHIASLGWSPSTLAGGITGKVVYVKQLTPEKVDEQKAELTGAIALIDSTALGEKPQFHVVFEALERLRTLSPLAILSTGIANGAESASSLGFRDKMASVPQAQIGREDSLLIKRLLERGPVTLHFAAINRSRTNVKIANVVADLPGKDNSAGIVLVGAHLDSWQPGTGAQDNGTGVAGAIETARAIKALHTTPRRTIRFVLFGGEEQGLLGSAAYVRAHRAELDKINAVLISDSGGEAAKGWLLMGREDEKTSVEALKPLLSGLGGEGISSDTEYLFLTDHAPFEFQGVPELVLWTGEERYLSLHHKASDTFDAVIKKDLMQGATVLAVTAFAIADSVKPFAPHMSEAEVRSMAEKSGNLAAFDYYRRVGVLP